VAAARAAFPAWAALPHDERAALCLAIADAIEEHAEGLARLLTLEQGKPLNGLGSRFELGGAVHWTRHTASLKLPSEMIGDPAGGQVELTRKPIGVCGSITPWNWPVLIAVWHIIPAILAGNTIVLKPSPLTPLSTLRLGELINELLPAGVVNIIAGGAEAGARLASHPGIAKIALTGSTETGRKVFRNAADNLARVTLELGGNDAGIVLPETDIAPLVEAIFWGAFINDGQTCGALKRLYVPQGMAGEIAGALAAYAGKVPMGDGLEEANVLGPLQNRAQFDKVTEYVNEALAKGAEALSGGAPNMGPGYFYPPTILGGCTDDMRVVSEEQFGPVLPVIGYRDLEDAIAAANAGPYGLGASVWSSDVEQGREIARRLEAGTVWVNQHGTIRPDVPFGGIKCSGMGVMFGEMGLKEFTTLQVVMS
jgi:acyl-CoA reductase-like NAD-dependent aldehyde dehydrogenase